MPCGSWLATPNVLHMRASSGDRRGAVPGAAWHKAYSRSQTSPAGAVVRMKPSDSVGRARAHPVRVGIAAADAVGSGAAGRRGRFASRTATGRAAR